MQLQPIGRVVSERLDAADTDFWGGVVARIELAPELGTQSLHGLADFSHVEVLFAFDRITPRDSYADLRPARGRDDMPAVGVFAGRGPNRPNPIGATICELVEVGDTWLTVRGLGRRRVAPVGERSRRARAARGLHPQRGRRPARRQHRGVGPRR
jgi:tRNA (Thr-GGU) A37 N-methylase